MVKFLHKAESATFTLLTGVLINMSTGTPVAVVLELNNIMEK
jgi:chorismate synthase